MFPSATTNHPQNTKRDDLGWRDENGLPTLRKHRTDFKTISKTALVARTEYLNTSTLLFTVLALTFSRVCFHERKWHVALSHIPDAQHPILPSSGHNMLLVRVSVHTMQRDSISSSKMRKKGRRLILSGILCGT